MNRLINSSLTKTDLMIANYLIQNKERIKEISINEICDELFISKSAVSKYCRKVGFSGFKELKYSIFHESHKSETNVKPIDMFKNSILSFFDQIDENVYLDLVKEINKSSKIVVFGQGQSLHASELLSSKLRMISKKNATYTSDLQQLAIESSHEGVLTIVISASAATNKTIEGILKLYEMQVDTILISEDVNLHLNKFIEKMIVLGNNVDYKIEDIRPRTNIYIFIEILSAYLASK